MPGELEEQRSSCNVTQGEEQRSSCPFTEGEQQERCGKRRRTDEVLNAGDRPDPADSQLPKRTKSHDVLFRIVVPSREIGRVIGKLGCRIQKIREQTKANIKIADAVAPYEQRVIIISSRDDDSEISDAENALYQIARLILQVNDGNTEALNINAGYVAVNVIWLLIGGSQVDCVIGAYGQNIENIRNASGASIMILAQVQFPLCASAHESDRLVQISGGISEVLKGVEIIGRILRENPPKTAISIRPMCNFIPNQPVQSYMAPTSADFATLDMMIPEALVGGLIGKSGSNISKIRNESGATIKVVGGRGEQLQRQIIFGGTSQQVATAKKLVEEYLSSQTGASQP